jgi:hypothetical protein
MTDFFPLRLLLATFAGWVNREQAQVVAYLVEENRVLKEQLRGRLSLPKTSSALPDPLSSGNTRLSLDHSLARSR